MTENERRIDWLLIGIAAIIGIAIIAIDMKYYQQPVQAQIGTRGRTFTCVVAASTSTSITAVGGDCVAPDAQSSLYITDVDAGASVTAGTSADTMMTLKSVPGNTCTTGTATVIWLAMQGTGPVIENRTTPIKVGNGNALCWIMTLAGTKTWVIGGYIGPG